MKVGPPERVGAGKRGTSMHLELWDIGAGRGIARYRSEDEALALVRALLKRYGAAYADDLDLGIEDDEGNTVESITGAALVARAEAAFHIAPSR